MHAHTCSQEMMKILNERIVDVLAQLSVARQGQVLGEFSLLVIKLV